MRVIAGRQIPETLEELLDPVRTTILLIDCQNDFAHADGLFGRSGVDLSLITERLPAIRAFVEEVRSAGLPLIHLHQQTLPQGASDSAAWLRFKTRSGRDPAYCLPGTWGCAAVEGLEPRAGEEVVVKFRPDGFLHTPLEMMLRAAGIETLVVCGLFTEGCVESTVRSASYRDFFVVVAEDAVASAVPQLHEGSLALMRARYPLHDSDEILAALARRQATANKT
ncbi:MAG: isochorismatase family cysteine hydrolase [Pseudomonadota bacterium]